VRDLLFIVVVVAFFAAAVLLVIGYERILSNETEHSEP
jgi:hypothetical protein